MAVFSFLSFFCVCACVCVFVPLEELSGLHLHYFSFNVSKMKHVGKKNLDFYLVPHFRCKDSYSIDSKLFHLRDISFCFCAIICMNSGTRRLYCDIINPYCYLKNDSL
uniref:Secreted protein n=1 Tax=Ailuropoda melanoleuca TaxID=9646 RepID=A0A7N5KMV0_AILME